MVDGDVSRQRLATHSIALRRRGVSLLELIIVLAIISIMMGLLFPAIHMVVQESRKTACDSNIHQLGLAMSQYTDVYRGFVPFPPVETRPSGWALALLPFIEETNLANLFDPEALFTSKRNLEAAKSRPPLFICPVTPYVASSIPGIEVTNYMLIVDSQRRDKSRRNRGWSFRDAPLATQFPWCSSPENKPYSEDFPVPHTTAFGL
jgi:prepilin-type N-terminal cleavage/methylation domain-containing protein